LENISSREMKSFVKIFEKSSAIVITMAEHSVLKIFLRDVKSFVKIFEESSALVITRAEHS